MYQCEGVPMYQLSFENMIFQDYQLKIVLCPSTELIPSIGAQDDISCV